jgi:hypothetical protein
MIGLVWSLVQVVLVFALALAVGLPVAYLSQEAGAGESAGWVGLYGMAAGVGVAVLVCHRARGWVLKSRLRRLRASGVSVQGVVRRLDQQWSASGRGGGLTKYVAHVQWRDPVTGERWQGERRYRFYGRGSEQLEAALADGAQVDLCYPADRPSRFIIDVPFAPTMADVLG